MVLFNKATKDWFDLFHSFTTLPTVRRLTLAPGIARWSARSSQQRLHSMPRIVPVIREVKFTAGFQHHNSV